MPIGPDKVGGYADTLAAEKWMARIDENLLIAKKSLNYTGHSFSVPSGMNVGTREYVMEQYREAGWTVNYDDNLETITLKQFDGLPYER